MINEPLRTASKAVEVEAMQLVVEDSSNLMAPRDNASTIAQWCRGRVTRKEVYPLDAEMPGEFSVEIFVAELGAEMRPWQWLVKDLISGHFSILNDVDFRNTYQLEIEHA